VAFTPRIYSTYEKNRYGRIVNVSSGAGALYYMEGGTPAYGISKVALNALTRKLSFELRGTGILVNSVDPGWVATDMGGQGGTSCRRRSKRYCMGTYLTR
jgi:NAD(P)-dependent dehydrogenase (short-subunit alcohol dehydrogenase family)